MQNCFGIVAKQHFHGAEIGLRKLQNENNLSQPPKKFDQSKLNCLYQTEELKSQKNPHLQKQGEM